MADVAASANDPIFLNHHAMVDCIFETWLQNNYSNLQYPVDDDIPKGHRKQDYIVPFFPLYKHDDIFSTADKFGYQCTISPHASQIQSSKPFPDWGIVVCILLVVFIFIVVIIIIIIIYYFFFKSPKKQKYRQFASSVVQTILTILLKPLVWICGR